MRKRLERKMSFFKRANTRFFLFFLSFHCTVEKICGLLDSNSDHQSKRQERWPLYRCHGSSEKGEGWVVNVGYGDWTKGQGLLSEGIAHISWPTGCKFLFITTKNLEIVLKVVLIIKPRHLDKRKHILSLEWTIYSSTQGKDLLVTYAHHLKVNCQIDYWNKVT